MAEYYIQDQSQHNLNNQVQSAPAHQGRNERSESHHLHPLTLPVSH